MAKAKPTKLTKSAKPAKSTKTTKVAASVKVAKPTKSTKVAKPTKSTKVVKPAKPTKLVKSAKSTKVVKPAKSTKVLKPAKPTKVVKSAKPTKAVKPAKPAKVVKSAKPTKAVKPAKPTKVVKPAELPKAVKTAEVTKSLKKPIVVETVEPAVVASTENKSSKGGGKKVKLKLKLKGQPESGKSEERKVVGAPYVHVRTVVVKAKLTPFLENQKEKLLILRDDLLDTMAGVAKDNLRSRAEGSEASAFGMHQADAGSDAYDRDFALSLLSQEQDALYEIEEALRRLDLGTYGICEVSGKPIPHARLEALPFARLTVECQSAVEKLGKVSRARVPVTSLFGLTDEEPGETEEEETVSEPKE